jgi:hypothetical protein
MNQPYSTGGTATGSGNGSGTSAMGGSFLLSRSFGRLYQYPSILSLPIQISLFAFIEYVPEAYMRRGFLTGFTGSAGTALITAHDAHL